MRTKAIRLLLGALIGASALYPLAAAAGEPHDLARRALTEIRGADRGLAVGYAVTPAGDVNGDGSTDLLIRPHHFGSGDVLAYVVFGGSSEPVDVSALGDRGFAITASEGEARLRSHEITGLSGMGDLNGDGLDEVVVGVPWADPLGRRNAGSVFVIHGKSDNSTVDLGLLRDQAIRIDGADKGDELGVAVATAEMDGDSGPELLLGAPFAGDDLPNAGKVYVVSPGAASFVDLATSFDGYSIEGPVGRQLFGAAVAGAGDMDGDGRDEIVVGAPSNYFRIRSEVFIVFGTDGVDIDLSVAGWRGWSFHSEAGRGDRGDLGRAVDGGADFNGDGIPDVVVGAPEAKTRNGYSGAAYVLFGGPDGSGSASIRDLGTAGLKMMGPRAGQTGSAVALIPDVSGDGRAEAVIGSPAASAFGSYSTGRVDIIPGTPSAGRLDLTSLDESLTYIGEEGDSAGSSVAFADNFLDSDGPTIAIGAPEATRDRVYSAGAVYLASLVAPANDLPPRATLYSYRARQRGLEGSYCWDGTCVDRMPSFPQAERAAIKDGAVVRFGISDPPDDAAVTAYRELDEFGRPHGDGRVLGHRIRPINNRPSVGHELLFRLPRRLGDLYLVVQARWDGEGRGDASWFFHLALDDKTYTDIRTPPDSHLLTRGTRQRGLMLTHSWSEMYIDGSGSHLIADAFRYGFPKGKPGVHGARARIRVHERHRPDRFVIRLYRRVKKVGEGPFASEYGAGRRRLVNFFWRAVRRDGRVVAHDAHFRLPARGRHAYYEVRGRWHWHGTAPWQFHLRLRG